MKKMSVLVMALFMIGCKGPRGDKGDTGIRGSGQIEVLSGSVTSNDFIISNPKIGQASQLTLYIGDGNALAESPYYIPGQGVNTYYLAGQSKVEVFNAALAGATRYALVLILP